MDSCHDEMVSVEAFCGTSCDVRAPLTDVRNVG